jgi:hypothetical protein
MWTSGEAGQSSGSAPNPSLERTRQTTAAPLSSRPFGAFGASVERLEDV